MAALFTVSSIATVAFVVCFVAIDPHSIFRVIGLGDVSSMNFALGLSLTVSLLGIGFGQIHWARKLMNSEEMVQERHPMKSSAADTAEVLAMAKAGGADSALPRRKLIWTSLIGAMAAFPVTLIVPLRDMGPLPKKVCCAPPSGPTRSARQLAAGQQPQADPAGGHAGRLADVGPPQRRGHPGGLGEGGRA